MNSTAEHKTVVSDHFDAYSRQWHERLKQHPYAARFAVVRRMVAALVPGYVIDVGCGTGDYCTLFGGEKWRYLGLDLSPQMVETCRNLYPDQDFSVADGEGLAAADASADLILNVAVLEYYDDPMPHLLELSRVAKPGASIIVAVPNGSNRSRYWGGALQTLFRKTGLTALKRMLQGPALAPPPIVEGYSKDSRIRHKRFSDEELRAQGAKVDMDLVERAYVSIQLLPRVFPLLARINTALSPLFGDRPAWIWLTRPTATILVCRFVRR